MSSSPQRKFSLGIALICSVGMTCAGFAAWGADAQTHGAASPARVPGLLGASLVKPGVLGGVSGEGRQADGLPSTLAKAVISIADYQPMFVGDSQSFGTGVSYTIPTTTTAHGRTVFRREVRQLNFPPTGQFLSLDRTGTLRQHGFIAENEDVFFNQPITFGLPNMQLPRNVGGSATFRWGGNSGTLSVTVQYLGIDTQTVVRTPAGTFRDCVALRETDHLVMASLRVDQRVSKIIYLGKRVREVALSDPVNSPLVTRLRVDGRSLPNGPGGLDAVAESSTVPDRMFPGTVRPVSLTFRNIGLLPWHPDDGFRLRAVGAGDPFVSSGTISLAPGTTVLPGDAGMFRTNFSAPIVPATYLSDWQMFRDGSGFFGGISTSTVVVNGAGPANLSFDATDVSPTAPVRIKPGDSLALGAFVDNNGGLATGVPFWLEVWGSRTGGLTLDAFLAPSTVIPALPPGQGFQLASRVPLNSVADGPYTLVYVADRLNQVAESTKRDNRGVVASKRLLVIRPQTNADLKVSGFNVLTNPLRNGLPVKFSGTVTNVGTENSGSFWIEFWGSFDRVNPELNFFLCDSLPVANLAPGASIALNTLSRNLYNCPMGLFKAGIYVDRLDDVNEKDETNNYAFVDRTFNMSPAPAAPPAGKAAQPDLVITLADFSPAAPTTLAPGGTLNLWARVENRGTAPSGPFWLEFWGSKLGGLSLDQFLADSVPVPEIPPGGFYSVTALARPLYSIPDGRYTVTVVADRLNQTADSNRANNRRPTAGKRLLTIRPGSPANLRIEGFSFGNEGTPLHRGQVVTPAGRVVNDGIQNSGPFWIEFWGSKNQDFPTLDFYVCDSILVPDLASGSSITLSASPRTLYTSLPLGPLAITGFADRSDLVSETNEADNYAIARNRQLAP